MKQSSTSTELGNDDFSFSLCPRRAERRKKARLKIVDDSLSAPMDQSYLDHPVVAVSIGASALMDAGYDAAKAIRENPQTAAEIVLVAMVHYSNCPSFSISGFQKYARDLALVLDEAMAS